MAYCGLFHVIPKHDIPMSLFITLRSPPGAMDQFDQGQVLLGIRPGLPWIAGSKTITATYNLLWNQQEWVTLPTLGIAFNIYYHS